MPNLERRTERLTLRLPESLRDACELAAQADKRTLSDWIVKTLSDAVGGTIAPGVSQRDQRQQRSQERQQSRANAPAERQKRSDERRAARRGGK